MEQVLFLEDWMTTPEMPLSSQLTVDLDNVLHRHGFYEIFYIVEGSIVHRLGNRRETLHPGDICFLRLNDVHIFEREPGNRCKHRDIVIQVDLFQRAANFLSPRFLQDYQDGKLEMKFSLAPEKLQILEEGILRIHNLPNNATDLRFALIHAYIIHLLSLQLEKSVETTTRYPAWLESLLSRFQANEFARDGLKRILEPFHFDRAYLCRTFRKYTGMTMTEYLNEIRLRNASNLLIYTDNTILSIANAVGFSSVSYFNAVFHKRYGCSPREFRKKPLNPFTVTR